MSRPDLTPRQVAIVQPADGDSIAGPTAVRARATDNTAVARVDFYVDSACVGTDSTSAGPIFEYVWNPADVLPGTAHILRCTAIDTAGNGSTSPAATIHVSAAAGTHHGGAITTRETWTADGNPTLLTPASTSKPTLLSTRG